MPNFQTLIAVLTALLVFVTSVFLAYDSLQFRNYTFIIPQWAGLSLAGLTFSFVAVDQILRGFIRLEEIQRQSEEVQRRAAEEQRRLSEARSREREAIRAENQRNETAERETRRTRIEARYHAVLGRFLLDPNPVNRRQLKNLLVFLDEYRDTL